MEYVYSNINAPNDFRVRLYGCKNCQKLTGTIKSVAFVRKFIKSKNEKDYWEQVNVLILEELKKLGG